MCRFGVFIVNFGHFSELFQVFISIILYLFSLFNFDQAYTSWIDVLEWEIQKGGQ